MNKQKWCFLITSFLFILFFSDGYNANPVKANSSDPHVVYSSHVQDIGWVSEVRDGQTAGTAGKVLPLEAFKLRIEGGGDSGVEYMAKQIDSSEWLPWVNNNEIAGTIGSGTAIEAFSAKLTGELAEQYDLAYRAHVQDVGWQEWLGDGLIAGTLFKGKQIDGIEFKLIKINKVNDGANIIEVSETDKMYVSGNKLILNRDPKKVNFSVKTNATDSEIFNKPNTAQRIQYGGHYFFDKEDYKTHMYESFQEGYGGAAITILNPKPTDFIEVSYGTVGTYEGQDVDLDMTISNISYNPIYLRATEPIHFTYPNSGKVIIDISASPYSGLAYANANTLTVEYKFKNTETQEPIEFTEGSYLVFNSLNGYGTGKSEFVSYLNDNYNAFVTKDTNVRYKVDPLMKYDKPVYVGTSDDFTDFIGGATFSRNSVQFQISDKNPKFIIGAGIGQQWVAISTAVLFNITPPDPVVRVLNQTGDDINEQNLKVGQNIIYSIDQKFNIIGQEIAEPYKSFTLSGHIPKHLRVNNISFVHENGTVLDNAGTLIEKNGKVEFTASENFLENIAEYNKETYSIRVEATVINNNLDYKNNVIFDNEATSVINGVDKYSNKVSNQLILRNINIKHRFIQDNKILKEKNDKKYDGEQYQYKHDVIAFSPTLDYSNVGEQEAKGIVNGNDINIMFDYDLSVLGLGVKKARIYTGNYQKGLDIELEVDTIKEQLNNYGNEKIELVIKNLDTNQEVFSKVYLIKDIEKSNLVIKDKIPPQYLEKNHKDNYEFKLVSKTDKVEITDNILSLHGYTASEKEIKFDIKSDNKQTIEDKKANKSLSYKHVIMTEKYINKDSKEYFEEWVLYPEYIEDIKSGYGIEWTQIVEYRNDLGAEKELVEGELFVEADIADGVYEEIKQGEDSYKKIPLDNKNVQYLAKNQDNPSVLTQKMVLSDVYVESVTGEIYLEKDSNSSKLYSGGNKFYVPIWIDELGAYEIIWKSEKDLGINQVSFTVSDEIKIEAYMFGHIGSETIDKDEILIVPVNLKDPFPDGLPKGWTEEDLKWLKK